MNEGRLLEVARRGLTRALPKRFQVEEHAVLLYHVPLDDHLQVAVDPRDPRRGQAGFQTDLCVFEMVEPNVRLPRVVVEFKTGFSTHDVITYSTKARRHKQVYPYLRYGLVVEKLAAMPRRFFVHNEAMDFALAAHGLPRAEFLALLLRIVRREISDSRRIQRLSAGLEDVRWCRQRMEMR
jgi:hypothetical protein